MQGHGYLTKLHARSGTSRELLRRAKLQGQSYLLSWKLKSPSLHMEPQGLVFVLQGFGLALGPIFPVPFLPFGMEMRTL